MKLSHCPGTLLVPRPWRADLCPQQAEVVLQQVPLAQLDRGVCWGDRQRALVHELESVGNEALLDHLDKAMQMGLPQSSPLGRHDERWLVDETLPGSKSEDPGCGLLGACQKENAVLIPLIVFPCGKVGQPCSRTT